MLFTEPASTLLDPLRPDRMLKGLFRLASEAVLFPTLSWAHIASPSLFRYFRFSRAF